MNEEIEMAIAEYRQMPPRRQWIIPVLLDSCETPDFSLRAAESLRDLQWVNLGEDWGTGISRLAQALSSVRGSLPIEKAALTSTAEPRNRSSAVLPASAIARATIAFVMGRECRRIISANVGEEIWLSYVRETDDTIWKFRCKVGDGVVLWAADSNGRWRDHPLDERLTFLERSDGLLEITEQFADRSTRRGHFRRQELQIRAGNARRLSWEELVWVLRHVLPAGSLTTYAEISRWGYGGGNRNQPVRSLLRGAFNHGFEEITNRVIKSDGGLAQLPEGAHGRQQAQLRAEGVRFTKNEKVDLDRCSIIRLVDSPKLHGL